MSEDYNLGFDAGYDLAISHEAMHTEYRNKKKKEQREAEIERKLYFAGQKLLGIITLIVFAVIVPIVGESDLSLVSVPLGLLFGFLLIFSKKRLLTVKPEGDDEEWW